MHQFSNNSAVEATGQSLPYLIGDLIKRNFPIFLEYKKME